MSSLADYNGCKFSAHIKGVPCEGELYYSYGDFYLLQDVKSGKSCDHTTDYKYSWTIRSGTTDDLIKNHVTGFKIHGKATIEAQSKSKFVVGDYVSVKDGLSKFEYGGTIDEFHKYGIIIRVYTLDKVNVEFNSGVEYTMTTSELLKSNLREYETNKKSIFNGELEFKTLKTFKL